MALPWLPSLSAFANSNTPGDWDAAKIHDIMTSGPDNHQVNLKTPIPIVIFYVTAIAAEDGHTHFFEDLYGYDQQLQQVLSKGPPYPVKPDPNNAIAKPGDTASIQTHRAGAGA